MFKEKIKNHRIFILYKGIILIALSEASWVAEEPVIDTGATAWMLTSTALVLLMITGLAMFYGGLVRTKNVIGTMMHSFTAMSVVAVLWVVVGYSMPFGPSVLGGRFGCNPKHLFLSGIDETIMSAEIHEYVFSMFQEKFAVIMPEHLQSALLSAAI